MTRIVTILTEGFADWETALLNAVGRSYYGFETLYATPDGQPVTSSGGLRVTPDLALSDLDPAATDALIVCGGSAWEQPDAPDVTAALRAMHSAGKIVAAICAGTLQMAKAGLLDGIAHTSNAPGFLDQTGYAGASHYRDGASAVLANRVVTAAGTSPVSFMERVMAALGHSDDNLAYYLGLHAAQFGAQKLAA
ncbi:MAG: glutamine amidotransferase [Hyphomicrobiales bacterium]|nr:MAG: glutamine amidotransferase [Hyphomicrobiales bacterium]